jgi:general nucleoside transport system ATP-binding protein
MADASVQLASGLLDCVGLSKSYPGVRACDGVALQVERGEIHALLGENGAGKSTLVKMIYGVVQPDAGWMTFEGTPHHPATPAAARLRGIGMVFQHFSLFDALSVSDNIALGLSKPPNRRTLEQRIVETAARYGLDIEPGQRAGSLSAGERQRVEIVRCLLQDPRLIIMDEPTSVLTPQEAVNLFTTLRTLAAEGRSVLYISHKLDEIRGLCSRATVLRAGQVTGRTDPRGETAKSLAEMMIGRELRAVVRVPTVKPGVRFSVSGLSLPADGAFGVDLMDVSLDVQRGEILGIAGVAGNGQQELMAALIGERPANADTAIVVDGHPVGRIGPQARRSHGMAFVPEERLGHATVPGLSLEDNVLLSAATSQDLAPAGFIRRDRAALFAEAIVTAFGVKTSGVGRAARTLSGGNLQKFIVGREILQDPGVLIAAQPTWGVDAGAAAAIHEQLLALAARGAAILVISQDLDELMRISDRVAVLSHGRLTAARPVASLTVEAIGLEMGGGDHDGAGHAAA